MLSFLAARAETPRRVTRPGPHLRGHPRLSRRASASKALMPGIGPPISSEKSFDMTGRRFWIAQSKAMTAGGVKLVEKCHRGFHSDGKSNDRLDQSMTPIHEIGPSRRAQASQVMSAPIVFPTRTRLRRALPGTIRRPSALIFKRIGAFGSPANRYFVAILPVTLARHQAIPSIDNSTFSIQPEALCDGGPGSPVIFLKFKIA